MRAKFLTGTKAMNCATTGTQNHITGPELHWLLGYCPSGSPFLLPKFPALDGEQSVQWRIVSLIFSHSDFLR